MSDTVSDALHWSGSSGEALLRAMLHSANVIAGVVEVLDDDFRYVVANRAATEFYGLGEGQLEGKTGRDLGFSDEGRKVRLEALRAYLAANGPTAVEYPARMLNGQMGWFLGSYSPIEGEAPRLSLMVIDITEQRRAQKMAEAQSARLALALEVTGLGIWEYDVATNQVNWDERMRFLFGVAPDVEIDFSVYAGRIHPEDLPGVVAPYEAALAGADGGRYSVEHRTTDREGRTRWIHGSARVIFDGEGQPLRVLGTAQDITDQVVARERQALLAAELNHRVKNNLTTVQAIANHTLRATRGDMDAFGEAFQDRLHSLARGHELLTRTNWRTPDLDDVLRVALEPFAASAISVTGGPSTVRLHPELAINLVMVLHELATNAAKYGALSRDGGSVSLAWAADERELVLDWRETGGPPVTRPRRNGFGTRLKDAALRAFGGVVQTEFDVDGLRCRLIAPVGEAVVVEPPARNSLAD